MSWIAGEQFSCPYCGSKNFRIVKVLFQSDESRLYACTCNDCGKVFLLHSDRHRSAVSKL